MPKTLLIVLLLLLPGLAWAEEPSLNLGGDYSLPLPEAPQEGGLAGFEPNYLLLWSHSSKTGPLRLAQEASFQLSLQKVLTQVRG